jgi:hemolysin activation/secretion protein
MVAFCANSSFADDRIVDKTVERSKAVAEPESGPVNVDAAISNAGVPRSGADYGQIEVGTIKSITLIGALEFAEQEGVKEFLEKELIDGKVKKVGDLEAAFAALRSKLSERGYYLAAVYPAAADAFNETTGELQLIVDAGRFGDISVDLAEKDGFHWYSREQVEKRLKGIDRNDVFNYFRLRSAIAELNWHPDLVADTKISVRDAGEGDKADSKYTRFADVALSVEDSFPLHFVWDINNYGMEEIDDWQSSLTVQYLNLTRADDVLTVTPAMSFNGDLKSISASYLRPFDWLLGMSGTVYGGYSDLDTDKVLPSLALEGTGWFAGFNWSANLYDDDYRNFAFNAGILYRYLEDEWSVAKYKLNKRDIGILPLTLGFSYADKKGDWLGGRDFFNVSLSFNLASTEDDLKYYTENADEHYMIFRAGWQRLQPLFAANIPDDQKWRAWSLYTRIEGQYSDDVLISAERLAYGGYNCLRGYRTRGYLGDNGVYGTAELRTPVLCDLVAGAFGDRTGKSPIDRLQMLVFTDLGWINFNDAYPNMEDDEFLFSAGFGARLAITKYTSLNCDVAFPLNNAYAHEKDDDVEVYISVKVQW